MRILLLLSTVLLFFSLFYQYYFSEPISIVDYTENQYDYIVDAFPFYHKSILGCTFDSASSVEKLPMNIGIIDKLEYMLFNEVGAGTSGCVIASKLSEAQNVTVLLIEAGGYTEWISSIPLAAPLLQGTAADWTYKTEPQSYSTNGFHNRTQFLPRGKGLGGSGQLNFLVHSFGNPEDYNDWPTEWSHAKLAPYFKRVESIMKITTVSRDAQLATAFSASQMEMLDWNATFTLAQSTLRNGARWSSYHAYLKQAWNQKNLHIRMNSLVTRVLFQNRVAQAIEMRNKDGKLTRINASREIILCGGAINTPQLLLLSGIGPAAELKKHKIPVVLDRENVGKNVHDHLNIPIYVNLVAPISVTLHKLKSLREIFKYFIFGTGLLASNAIIGIGRSNSWGLTLFGMGTADEKLLKQMSNFQTTTFRRTFPSYDDEKREGFIYLATCLRPKSRGTVTLKSNDSSDPPIINPGYLNKDYDVVCTQQAIKMALVTLGTKPFVDLGATVHAPDLEECKLWKNDYNNPGYTECLTRTVGLTSHHLGGTCKMGYEEDGAVVNESLRVIGIDKLRIIDASILPSPISGMPNSVIIAMAHRAADIIMTKE